MNLCKSDSDVKTVHKALVYKSDRIYGLISVPREVGIIMKHPVFQRMRDIKQLGTINFFNKNATHTRYEHSIGVAYLAYLTINALAKKHSTIKTTHIKCVTLAGLCHDLGHGPYSHTYDSLLSYVGMSGGSVQHEVRSQILFRYMVEDIMSKDETFTLTEEEILLVQYFIDTKKFKRYILTDLTKEKISDWQFHPTCVIDLFPLGIEQIVSNSPFKIDVDKMDYIIRDATVLHNDAMVTHDIDIISMLNRSMLIDGIWVFDCVDSVVITNLLYRRQLYYINCYNLPRAIGVENTFKDILQKASSNVDIVSCAQLDSIDAIKEFCSITDDDVLNRILSCNRRSLNKVKQKLVALMGGELIIKMTLITKSESLSTHRREVPFNVLKNSSSPERVLPNVSYHHKGKLVDPTDMSYVHEIDLLGNGRRRKKHNG